MFSQALKFIQASLFCLLLLMAGKSTFATELITNPSFETVGSGWVVLTNGTNQTDSWWNINNSAGANSGNRYVYLGAQIDGVSAANNVNGLLYQTVTIPAGTTSANLTYYVKITSSESTAAAYDTLKVEIQNASGTVLATPNSFSNQNATGSWTQQTVNLGNYINLSSYAGQAIRIAFHGTTDGSTITVFRIDDVSLQASGTTATAPSITSQAASQSISSGQTATLTVVASGTSPLTYQWYQGSSGNTSTPVGGNSSSYVTPSLTATTSYWVRVSNSVSYADSSTATVTVTVTGTAPSITTHPASQSISSGQTATLTVVASGTSPLTYQWYQGSSGNTSTPVGNNSSSYATPSLTATTSYWVRVSNSISHADSYTATVTYQAASSIFTIGSRIMAAAGGTSVRNAQFADPPLFIQWGGVHGTITSGSVVGGVNNSFYTGNWWQINWDSEPPNQNGIQGWSAESVILLAPPAGDVSQPNFSSSYYNTTTNPFFPNYAPNSIGGTIGVGALGNCTWYANGRLRELGYNSTQLNALLGNASQWATQASAAGIVVDSNPTIGSIAQLNGCTSGCFSTLGHVAVVESVNADGTITVSESSYSTSSTSIYNFLWHHRTVSPTWFSNFIHVSTGTSATAPSITSQPSSQSISNGQTATLSVVASGTSPLTYQWYQGSSGNTSTPVGGNSNSYATPVLTATTSYWVRVSNSINHADSSTATVIVTVTGTAPSITTQPASQSISSDQTATLTVVASGTSPLAYQWYQGGSGNTSTPVGSNSNSYTTSSLTATTSYWVRVSNSVTSADSNTATVSVTQSTSDCSNYSAYFEEASSRYSIPSNLLRAVALAESTTCYQGALNPSDGGCGVMQLTGATKTSAANLLSVTEAALCENTIAGARLNILGGAAVLSSKKCWNNPRVFSTAEFNQCASGAAPLFTQNELLQLSSTLETWWWSVAAYNGGGQDGFTTTSNYPFRVWNKFNALNLAISYPPLSDTKYLSNGSPLPDNPAKFIGFSASEIQSGDDALFPQANLLAPGVTNGIRWVRGTFNFFTDIITHNNDGSHAEIASLTATPQQASWVYYQSTTGQWYISESAGATYLLSGINGYGGEMVWGAIANGSPVASIDYLAKTVHIAPSASAQTSATTYPGVTVAGARNVIVTSPRGYTAAQQLDGQTLPHAWYYFKVPSTGITGTWYIVNVNDGTATCGVSTCIYRLRLNQDNSDYAWVQISNSSWTRSFSGTASNMNITLTGR